MSLEQKIMEEMKDAMKAKNEGVLRSLRAIKAEIIKAKTDPGAGGTIDEATEQKFLQKMMKQRRDSLEIFEKQGRADLAEKEKEELTILNTYLPQGMTSDELAKVVRETIAEVGATSKAQMGAVMKALQAKTSGRADGKTLSSEVQKQLT